MSFSRASSATLVATVIAIFGCGEKEEHTVASLSAVAARALPPRPEVTVLLGHVASQAGLDNAARMAVDELNSKALEIGGARIKFELLSEDDQSDPEQGAIATQKLIDAKVTGVVGHLSITASRIYSEAGIPQIFGSSIGSKSTRNDPATTFRIMASGSQQGRLLGDYAVKKMAAKTVAIVDDRSGYGRDLADEFEESVIAAGSKVAVREFTNDQSTDFTAILNKMRSKKVDVVFYGGMAAQGGTMIQQMKSLGLKAKFLTGDGACTQELIKLAGTVSEGLYCSLPGVPLDQMPGGKAFGDAFSAKYGQMPRDAPYIYDAVMVMVDAMKRTGSVEPARFLPMISKANYNGVTAKLQFDDEGDLKDGAISVYRAKGGQWQFIEIAGAQTPHKGTDEDDDE